ncbi:YbdD/YjiX family protein [Streptomyces tailanensis]|uniref:YbdD/YjiX family protein n=1 Tax=Streptomyces tailanensis TaxID=2569858 RepID=UPI00122DC955
MRSLGRVVRGVRWYVRELTDESAYDRYMEHLRTHDPGGGPLPLNTQPSHPLSGQGVPYGETVPYISCALMQVICVNQW